MATTLTDKQQLFCIEYVKCHNATLAATNAGYSCPHVQGSRLMTNVRIREEIKKLDDNKVNDLRIWFKEVAEEKIHQNELIVNAILSKVFGDNPDEIKTITLDKDTIRALSKVIDVNNNTLDRAGYKPSENINLKTDQKLEDWFK